MLLPEIRAAQCSDRTQLASMRSLLWPDATFEEHVKELDAALSSGISGSYPMAILVAQQANGTLIGFLEVGMRSHADGCDPVRPVGFVEGWFVREEFRNGGVGRQLMLAAETWARVQGCLEIASDTWIDNEESQRAHQALGFEIVDRCVNFRKAL
jgi:aminoglycoside 6'-N-acetyltransferase I